MAFNDRSRRMPRPLLYVLGVLSGLIAGMYGVGVLSALLVGQVTESADEMKACLGVVYSFCASFIIIGYAMTGLATWQTIGQAALLAPVMILGMFLGMKLCRGMKETALRRMIAVFLMISGVLVILSSGLFA